MPINFSALHKTSSILAGGFLLLLASSPTTFAAQCGSSAAGFDGWLQGFKAHAASAGIRAGTISSALSGVTYDPTVIRLDHSQRSFKLSFDRFYALRVDGALIARGKSLMAAHRGTLSAIEQRFGVPGAVVVAIWGLETHYGADTAGGYSIIRSLATLSYDCRRSDFFTDQLLAALKLVDRGSLSPQAVGAMQGEIGQTQFLPKNMLLYGAGNLNSKSGALMSTANFLKAHGWRLTLFSACSSR